MEKKKTELALKSRKEIADYISSGKVERAKIRVEHIIREDYLVEAMEILEMYCDLLLARCVFKARMYISMPCHFSFCILEILMIIYLSFG